MFCKYCGKEIEKGEAFCSACGKPVTETGAAPAGIAKKHIILIVTLAAVLMLGLILFLVLRNRTKAASAPESAGEFSTELETEEAADGQTKPEEGAAEAEAQPAAEPEGAETQTEDGGGAEQTTDPWVADKTAAIDAWYQEIQAGMAFLTIAPISNDVTVYRDGSGNTVEVAVAPSYDGGAYTKEYFYRDGALYFAHILSAGGEMRLYYENGELIRLVDESGAVHDYGTLDSVQDTGEIVASQAKEVYTLAAGGGTETAADNPEPQAQAEAAPAPEPEPEPGWKTAYAEIVKKDSGNQFALIYVNGDEIPELVSSNGPTVWLYTFQGKKTVTLIDGWGSGAGGDMGTWYVPKQNVIINANADYAGAVNNYYLFRIDDGGKLRDSAILMSSLFPDLNGNGMIDGEESFGEYAQDYIYYKDGVEIAADEFFKQTYENGGSELIEGNLSQSEMLGRLAE